MKKYLLFSALLLASMLLFSQDTTATEPGQAFNVSWPDVFDLIDLVLAWAIGVSAGRWRQILQALASVLPFLRNLANEQDKRALINIEAVRTARLKKAGQPVDLEVSLKKPLALVLLLLLSAPALYAQGWIEPAKGAGLYPTAEVPGLEFYMRNHLGDSIPINNGDTVFFDYTEPNLLAIVSDTPVVYHWEYKLRSPLFAATNMLLPYWEVRQYRSGANEVHQYHADSLKSSSTMARWPAPVEGHYYALLLTDSLEGRFIRFYLATTETVAFLDTITVERTVVDSITVLDTALTVLVDTVQYNDTVRSYVTDTMVVQRTVIDSVAVEVPVEVYVATDANQALEAILDTALVPVIDGQEALRQDVLLASDDAGQMFLGIAESIGSQYELAAVMYDSLATGQQAILEAVAGGGAPAKSLEEVLLEELAGNDVTTLVGRFYKSRTIEVEGHQISTCTFATWAGVPCSLSETTIFTAAKEVAATN